MNSTRLTITELMHLTERELRAALGGGLATVSCETFAEKSFRGGFRLVLADGDRRIEILYSDLQIEIRDDGVEVFGNQVHPGFAGNMFSREHLEEHLPRIAASVAGG